MVAFIVALIAIATMIKDFLVDNLVEILVDMPSFDYSFTNGEESGNQLFNIYKSMRDTVFLPLIIAGMMSWLIFNRFGHKISFSLGSEETQDPLLKADMEGKALFQQQEESIITRETGGPEISFGKDQSSSIQNSTIKTILNYFYALPSKCLFIIILLLIFPPVWDMSINISKTISEKILNNMYSGDENKPCPSEWYTNGVLDISNTEFINYYKDTKYLIMHDKSGQLDAVCRPEMKVRFMLEQWGGETKVIAPPFLAEGNILEIISQMWDNSSDWFMRGLGEFFVNVIMGIVKAQAVIISGTLMILSNILVDVGIAMLIIFMPVYFLIVTLIPNTVVTKTILQPIKDYGPATLAAALVYPIEVAILFALSSELMISMMSNDYGNNALIAWLFGTTIMSMVIAIPIVTLGAFSKVLEPVMGQATMLVSQVSNMAGSAGGLSGKMGGAANKMGGVVNKMSSTVGKIRK